MRVIYILYTIFNIGGKIDGVEARPLSRVMSVNGHLCQHSRQFPRG